MAKARFKPPSNSDSSQPPPPSGPGPHQLLTVEEVSERLRISPQHVRVWLREKRLRGKKLGKAWRVTWAAVDDFMGSW